MIAVRNVRELLYETQKFAYLYKKKEDTLKLTRK